MGLNIQTSIQFYKIYTNAVTLEQNNVAQETRYNSMSNKPSSIKSISTGTLVTSCPAIYSI